MACLGPQTGGECLGPQTGGKGSRGRARATFIGIARPDPVVTSRRRFAALTVATGLLALAHAIFTWPLAATVALFGGGMVVAFVAEAVVINGDWLEHHIGPKLLGVPLYLLLGWTGTVYIAYRVALHWSGGWTAVIVAAVLATGYDVLADHRGVAEGFWSYTDDVRGPRFRGVPWWNFLGWVLVTFVTAALARPFL